MLICQLMLMYQLGCLSPQQQQQQQQQEKIQITIVLAFKPLTKARKHDMIYSNPIDIP